MATKYTKRLVTMSDVVAVEDAEALLNWYQQHPKARVDLARCTHLHPANLQVLMAAQAKVNAWPTNRELSGWLATVLVGPAQASNDPDTGTDE